MRFVDVRGIGELCLFADNFGEDDVLLEQKNLEFARFYHNVCIAVSVTGRCTFGAKQRAVQQQFTLSRYFALEFLQTSNVHHVVGGLRNDL